VGLGHLENGARKHTKKRKKRPEKSGKGKKGKTFFALSPSRKGTEARCHEDSYALSSCKGNETSERGLVFWVMGEEGLWNWTMYSKARRKTRIEQGCERKSWQTRSLLMREGPWSYFVLIGGRPGGKRKRGRSKYVGGGMPLHSPRKIYFCIP